MGIVGVTSLNMFHYLKKVGLESVLKLPSLVTFSEFYKSEEENIKEEANFTSMEKCITKEQF